MNSLPFNRSRLCHLALLGTCLLIGFDAVAALQPISSIDPSVGPSVAAGGDSVAPILSADGRYVLFASTANNLVVSSYSTAIPLLFSARYNLFLRDRTNGTTTLISVNTSGTNGGNDNSIPLALSADGRYVLFESSASDLVNNDTNNATDIFVRDQVSGTTVLVSVATNGLPGNGASRNAVMTPDNRYVAFSSAASDLIDGDTNGIRDIFVRDLQTGTTVLASVGAQSTGSSDLSDSPAITADGRYVAFYSSATNLVPGISNVGEVYVRDLTAQTTTWASIDGRSLFYQTTGSSNAISCSPSISEDGTFVAFETCTNHATFNSARGIALRYNLSSGTTELIHTNVNCPIVSLEDNQNVTMSPDGRFVLLVANANDFSGASTAIYLWDSFSGTNIPISLDISNNLPLNALCDSPTLSSNGQFVAFISSAANLTTNTLSGDYHVYVRDVSAGTTRLVDIDTNGVGSGVSPIAVPRLSANGSLVAFETVGRNVVANDGDRASAVFLRDLTMNTTELISVRHADLPDTMGDAMSGIFAQSVSVDGRYLAFWSEADNLVANDTNQWRDVFRRDLFTGTTLLVSLSSSGNPANGFSSEPAISADGRYIAFSSFATNLFANDTNNASDVFVRDVQTGTTTLVSVTPDGVSPGNKESYQPSISPDGRFILFQSKAQNLVAGVFSSTNKLFLRDMQIATNYSLTPAGLVSGAMSLDGRFVAYADFSASGAGKIYVWNTQLALQTTNTTTNGISQIAISPDGSKIASFSFASGLRVVNRLNNSNLVVTSAGLSPHSPNMQFSANGSFLAYAVNSSNQVYLCDTRTGTSVLVSKAFDSATPASGGVSDSPTISADGRFVIFRSSATNVVAGDSNGVPDLFVYDQVTGTNSLFDLNRSKSQPNNRARFPIFSANGRTVAFQGLASDLAANDFNQTLDVLAYDFPYIDILAGSSPANGAVLKWPSTPGQISHVQYKDNISDSLWQDLAGAAIQLGNRAFMTNLPPVPDQRFYRVITE
jgi:hypothetical protein